MGLFEAAREAVQGSADLRIGQALEIARAYDESLEQPANDTGRDEADLPFPKDTIKWALLLLLGSAAEASQREQLKAAYVALAEWQDPARLAEAIFDSARLRRKIDPLTLAREFAAQADAGSRHMAASRAEQARLIDELRRRGFW
jgi:hypothetical protein